MVIKSTETLKTDALKFQRATSPGCDSCTSTADGETPSDVSSPAQEAEETQWSYAKTITKEVLTTNSVWVGFGLIALLNRYPIILPPSKELDFFGRINNLYQILSHVGVGLKFLGFRTEIFGAADNQHPMDFQIMNALDYAGWIAIFSRLDSVPWLTKTIANTHVSTGIMCFLGHTKFEGRYLQTLNIKFWDWMRAAFVFADAATRSYYHFYVLKNV